MKSILPQNCAFHRDISRSVKPCTFSFGFFSFGPLSVSCICWGDTMYCRTAAYQSDQCKQETYWLEYEQTAERKIWSHTQKHTQARQSKPLSLRNICLFSLQMQLFWLNFTVRPHAIKYTLNIWTRPRVIPPFSQDWVNWKTQKCPIYKQSIS